jgi:hypothetical protein
LQRLFSTFPGRAPGSGLLLLRATVGITAAVRGAAYLADRSSLTLGMWAVGFLVVVSGALLLIGFLTPVACALTAVGSALSCIQGPTPLVLGAKLATCFVVIIATAIGLLGPGAFSLDSHLFGRREIIIPSRSRKP